MTKAMTSRRLCGASRCCKAKARDGTEMKVRAAGLVLPQAPRWCCAARRRYRPWCLAAPEMRLTNPLMSRGLNGREPPGGEDRGEGQWAYAVRHYSNTLSFLNQAQDRPDLLPQKEKKAQCCANSISQPPAVGKCTDGFCIDDPACIEQLPHNLFRHDDCFNDFIGLTGYAAFGQLSGFIQRNLLG